MHAVILGCGRVGAHLATALAAHEHDVAVIDRRPESFKALGLAFNGVTVTGVGIDEDVLRRAGIEQAGAFVAVTSHDTVNAMAAQMAKVIYGVPRVVSRINSPGYETIFREFGIETICPTDLGALSLLTMLQTEGVHVRQVLGAGEVVVSEVHVTGLLVGRSLSELDIGGKVRVAAVLRDDRALVPDGDYRSHFGDVLIVATRRDALETLRTLATPRGR